MFIIAGSTLLDYLAVNTWLEFLISAALAFPFIVLICWILLLDTGIKKIMLKHLIERLPLKIKSIFIKEA